MLPVRPLSARLAALARRLRRDRRGNTTVMFSLSLLPVVTLAGAAVDYSRAGNKRADMQSAVDAAALGAVLAKVGTDGERVNVGRAIFRANLDPALQATPSVTVNGRTVSVAAAARVKTAFLHIANVPDVEIAASARAARIQEGPPPCLLALNPTAPGAVTITGSSSLVAEGCVVHANSRSQASPALLIDGNTAPRAAGFCAAGRAYASPGLNVKPAPESFCDPMEDPFMRLPRPAAGACTAQNLEVSPQQTRTLGPGTYCGGLTLKGTVTLQPGVYVIRDGLLSITSQARVTGSGVTFFITGVNSPTTAVGFTIDGQGGADLRAPTSGTYGGVLIYQDSLSGYRENTLAGGSTTRIMGAIYAPKQKVTVAGGSGFGQTTAFMPVIADQIRISGHATTRTDVTGLTLAAPLPRSVSGGRLEQ